MSKSATKKYFGWFVPKKDGKLDIARAKQEFTDENWQEFERIVGITSELRPFVIDYISLRMNSRLSMRSAR